MSWSHYRTLTKVEHRAERLFYEIEAEKQNWSVPQLERQIDSLLFGRLLKSRDEAGLLELSTRGQVIESPADALKDPYVLDFLDLPGKERGTFSTLSLSRRSLLRRISAKVENVPHNRSWTLINSWSRPSR